MKKHLIGVLIPLLFLCFVVKNLQSNPAHSGASPDWITPVNSLNVTLQCNDQAGLAAAQAMKPSARNNCDASPLNITKTSGIFVPSLCAQSGTYTNTWIATDQCGNTSTVFNQVITIENHTNPVILPLPGLSVIHCTEVPSFTHPTVTVGCDLNITLTYSEVTTRGDCPSSYKITRTWIARDACGNSSQSASQTISVVDDIGPLITTPRGSLDREISCSDDAGLNSALSLKPEGTDECSSTALIHLLSDVVTPIPGKLSDYLRERKWNFTDACGNASAEFSQHIMVTDRQNPTITAPPAVNVFTDANKCGASGVSLGTPVTADNCSIVSLVNDAVEPFQLGSTTVTWTVTDGAGNQATAIQIVTVADTIRPAIVTPANVTTGNDPGTCGATRVNLGNPATNDNCSVGSVVNDAVEPFPIGNTTVTWTVRDASGNLSKGYQIVTVTDIEKPVIAAPPAVTVNNDPGTCGATGVNLGIPVVSDNCSLGSIFNDANEPFPSGRTVVTWTVKDAAGNTATSSQIVTVVDNQFPTITAPLSVSVSTDPGKNTASQVNLGLPVVTDNCSATFSNNAVEPFALGRTTVTWTATDLFGNKTTATQTITVTDKENPVFKLSDTLRLNTDPGLKTRLFKMDISALVGDNDQVATLSYQLSGATRGSGSSPDEARLNMGMTTIILTATDRSGNANSQTLVVTVSDKESPRIVNCFPNEELVFKTNTGNPVYTIPDSSLDIIATDNDSVKTISYTMAGVTNGSGKTLNGIGFNIGETDVLWTATDLSGNSSKCQVKMIIQDGNPPPVLVNDHFTAKEGIELTGNVCLNDSDLISLKGNLPVTLMKPVSHGKLVLEIDGTFTYLVERGFMGEDHFSYQICKTANASSCSEADVTITVEKNENCPVLVPDSFSPNGDGRNDYFKINCLSAYPDAVLKIYTRSGVKVYEQKNYGNTDFWGSEQAAFWNGRTENKLNLGGTKLSASTYIYLLELEKGNKDKVLTGTVFLNY